MLYSHIHVHAGYILTQWITDARNDKDARRKTQEDFFNNILPLTLFVRVQKVIQGLRVRGSWRPNRNCYILTSTLMAINVVFSHSSDAHPEAQRPPCWVMAFFKASYQHLLRTSTHQGREAPFAWYGFLYHISSITGTQLALVFCLDCVI